MSGKLCVVTGTSSGIGKAVAEGLLEDDWDVLGLARREAPIAHAGYTHVQLDLADPGAVEDYFEHRFADQAGLANRERVGLVNNAALLAPVNAIEKLGLQELNAAYTVNSVVPLWLMGYFLRNTPAVPLRIVNVSSGAAFNAVPGWASYCSTKAALHMAGEVLGRETGAYDVERDVSLVSYAPGIVDTEMQGQIRTKSKAEFPGVERFQGYHAEGQLADPRGPAGEIVAYLGTDGHEPASTARFGG